MKLKVYACLHEDINNGWVWLPESIANERVVVKLQNRDSGRSIYCEALPIGDNFFRRYNQSGAISIADRNASLVVNEWYRKKLGIATTQSEHDFKVASVDNPYGHLRASLQHPQIVVRLAMELAILGVILATVGLFK